MKRSPFPARPLPVDLTRVRLLADAVVVPEPGRCVQCGLCSYNCPMGVDTRSYARSGLPVSDPDERVIGDPNPDWTAGVNAEGPPHARVAAVEVESTRVMAPGRPAHCARRGSG